MKDSVARRLASRQPVLMPPVSVSSTDNGPAIRAAVALMGSRGGGVVQLPPGEFLVGGTGTASQGGISLPDNVALAGSGMGVTVLKVKNGNGAMTGIVRTPSGVVSKNCGLRDITLDGNKANNIKANGLVIGYFCGVSPGVAATDEDIWCERVEIRNCNDYGFDPHEQTTRLRFIDCVSHDNDLDGFVADYIIDGTYSNCIAYNNARHGFNITTSTYDFALENCTAYGNAGNGAVVQRGSELIAWPRDIRINGGCYRNNTLEGVLVQMGTGVTVTGGAKIYGNGRRGVRLYGATYCNVTGNDIYNNSQTTNNLYDEIQILDYDDTAGVSGLLYGSTNNVIGQNTLRATASNKSRWGIREEGTNTGTNTIMPNVMHGGFVTGEVSLASATSIMFNDNAAGIQFGRAASSLTTFQNNGRIRFGSANEQTTVGAAGGASALPATPIKYFRFNDSAGNLYVIPAYNA